MKKLGEVTSEWTREEVSEVFNRPLFDLLFEAQLVTRQFHTGGEVQVCELLSIKTGGCQEDCKYCSQSMHYETQTKAEPLLKVEEVLSKAKAAKESGATRFCMGAAWREVKDNKAFDRVLEMVREVNSLGLEVCATLGMLTEDQAIKLKEAGLYAYNHNLDTSESFYSHVISTRTYADRLETLKNARSAGLTLCCGGILGLGESDNDRIDLILTLCTLPKHPESVPINCLVPIEGTPLESHQKVDGFTLAKMIATARITMPKAMVRLSAGRLEMSDEAQALCFLAGANSIFGGEKLLTTPNPEVDRDEALFKKLGLTRRAPYKHQNDEEHVSQ